MSLINAQPAIESTPSVLYRQDTELSKSDFASINTEKGLVAHNENVQVPDTISEEDEDAEGNVGIAAYEKSKQMAEIVSPFDAEEGPIRSLPHPAPRSDTGAEQSHPPPNRLAHPATIPCDSWVRLPTTPASCSLPIYLYYTETIQYLDK
jgi:hypothetical protein